MGSGGGGGQPFQRFRPCLWGLCRFRFDVLANFVSSFDRIHPQISTNFRPLLDRYFRFWHLFGLIFRILGLKWKDNGYFSAFALKNPRPRKCCSQNLPKRAKRRFSKGGGDLETTGARNDRQISRNVSTISISTSTRKFRKKNLETCTNPKA